MGRKVRCIAMVALLTVLLSVSMTGCGKGGPVSFSELISGKDGGILYITGVDSEDAPFDQNTLLDRVIVFKKGKAKVFSPNWNTDSPLTMGDVSQMSDKEIVEELERRQEEGEEKNIDMIRESITKASDAATSSSQTKEYERMEKELSGMEENKNDYLPYVLYAYTDDTGREVEREGVQWCVSISPYMIDETGETVGDATKAIGILDWHTGENGVYFNPEEHRSISQKINNSYYTGYCGTLCMLVRCKDGTVVTTDAMDSKSIVLDPSDEWWADWRSENNVMTKEQFEKQLQEMAGKSETQNKSYNLTMGGVDASDDVSTKTMEKFAELVDKKTGGAVTIKTCPAGQLGSYDEMYQKIKRGNMDAGLFMVYGEETDPAIEVVYLPYLATDNEEFKKVFARDGDIWNEVHKIHSDQGVELLGFYNNGYVGMGLSKLSTPKDKLFTFGEQKEELVRVPGMESMQEVVDAMGYETVVLPFGDISASLKTGTIDGEWSGGPSLNYYNFKDDIKYFVDYHGAADVYMMVMNQEVYEGMPEEYQMAIKEAADEATAYGNELQVKQDNELLGKLQEEGITVYEPTDAQLKEMQSYCKKNVWPEITKAFNTELVKTLSK